MKPAMKPAKSRGATVVKAPGSKAQVFKTRIGKPLTSGPKRK